MVTKIKAARAGLPSSSGSSADAVTQADAMLLALCTGILNEITTNSELVSVTHDAGAAGAGIITGKVQ
jgi:hypothetical protein